MSAQGNPGVSDAEQRAGGFLFRSRMEIVRILGEMALERALMCAELERGEMLFMTRVIGVERETGVFLTAYSDEKRANAAVLERRTVAFTAQHRGTRVEFSASDPQDALFRSEAVLRWNLPEALVQFQRRTHQRYSMKGDASLRCVADSAGIAPFEARIADISLGGAGMMVYGGGIKLAPGTVLKGCRVVVPGRDAVLVDVAVLPDGTLVNRSGVRFLNASRQLGALVSNFVVALKD